MAYTGEYTHGLVSSDLKNQVAVIERPALASSGSESESTGSVTPPVVERNLSHDEAFVEYWKSELSDLNTTLFPSVPQDLQVVLPDQATKHRLTALGTISGATPESIVCAAWALAVGPMIGTQDVVLGIAMSGGSPSGGGDSISMVPFRLLWSKDQRVDAFLQSVQRRVSELSQTGLASLAEIAQTCSEARQACEFQTVLTVGNSRRLFVQKNRYPMELDVHLEDGEYVIEAAFNSKVVPVSLVERLLARVDLVVHQLGADTHRTLDAINSMTEKDLRDIWNWNRSVPATIERCVHSLIEDQVDANPDAPAICSWDGDLTYAELDDRADQLANRLATAGLRAGDVVALCFTKSMWANVAMLGVLKAGGTLVMLDPALPEQRLQSMTNQVGARLLISSLENKELGSRLCKTTLVVEVDGFEDYGAMTRKRVQLDPSSIAYIQFTSGSTGVPKGAAISHQSMSSGIHHQLRRLDLGRDTRLYDFSTYSFDMALYNAFFALSSGGCLCVPSESGRKDDLAGSIRNTGANTLLMTPSTAQTIRPDDVPAVNKVLFGGEAVHERDAAAWWGQAKVLNMYGPCECTPCSIIGDDLDHPAQAVYIGRGCGTNTWVVDPEDHERLVPPGCVGELLLEGPLVTAGYLNDAERNSRAYAVDPPWIVQGVPGITGRRARLYKTGDLVRYTENGALAFVSRKDTQVKIRGQRIELGEVEYRVHQSMPQFSQVAAEVVKPINSNPMLIAFLVDENAKLDTVELYEPPGDFGATIAENLPTYMIPSVYLSISKMPLTATEKINRKRLREIGATLLPRKLAEMAASGESKEQPSSDTERHLQRIWAEVLNFQDCTAIGTRDSFLRLGGDSIAAMRVVRALKDVGLHLSVSLVLGHPTLRDMAAQAVGATGMIAQSISRFSLLPSGCDVETVLRPYGLDALQVEDVFPCTSLQEGLVSLSSQRSGDYVTQAVLKLSSDTSVGRFRGAWEDVTRAIPLLRTRFVQGDSGLLQVVVEEPVQWQQADDLKAYLESDRKRPMELGQTFTRCALMSDGDNGRVTDFVLTAHHALHDGWSMGLAMDALNRAYGGEGLNPLPPFQRFIQYTQHQNYEEASEFWKKRLQDCESVPYPILPASVDKPSADSMISCALPNPSRGVEFTTTTIIRAAWALVAGCMVNSDDVVYGGVVSGRSAEVADIDRIPGPTIATVPLRFHLDKNQTISSFLKTVQQQATDMIPYEQMGLLRIAQLSTDCEQACGFQTLLVIQPETVDDGSSLGRFEEQNAMQWSSTYGLVLVVQLAQSQSSISASFDSRLIDSAAVQSLLDRLGFVIGQLSCTNIDSGMCLEDISALTPSDFDTLWAWNKAVPERIDMCIHEVVHRRAVKTPDQIAVCAWDGELTYGELDGLSTKLAGHLSINKEEVVPLCFQKTVWTPVAMLAVLKAGGTFLLLDPALPQARLEVIVESVDAKTILSTRECAQLSSTLVQNLITVDAALLSDLADTSIPTISDSSLAAYIIFTSGSTGTPKGVMITHSNVVSAVTQHCRVLEYTETSRIFDFSSYSFGASLNNMLCALTSGACLCVPSDEDRRSDLAASITKLRATDVLLTPSMAEHLSPSSVPTLRSLILGGEAVRAQDAGQWLGRVKLRTAYGQSEGTTIATINPSPTTPEETTRIGHGVGTVTWVVDPGNHENLLPPGAIGELLIEGPAVGRGYFRDEEKAAEVFIRDPSWLLSIGRRGKLYKTGDLVRYNSDTTLSYVGRKDSQVKIRGQRIELGDVEYWVRELMPEADKVAVEAITPSGPGGRPTLAAFIQMSGTENSDTPNLIRVDGGVIQLLKQQLPRYMVPTVFTSMPSLPMTPTGKINRRELRNLGSSFSVQDIAAVQPLDEVSNRPPVTDRERRMQGIWSQILNRPREEISLNSSFFHLGGDSINAMKVASAARQAGLDITVANIFQYRTLRLIADRARYVSTEEVSVAPFTLVNGDADVAKDIARSCGVGVEIIEDAYPCAPLQEGLMSLASRRPGDYIMQASLELSDAVDITAFRRAWETVSSVTAVLRTRFVQHDKLGLLQAVLGTSIDWHETTGLDEYLSSDRKNHMNLSTPLVRFALVKDHAGQTRWFVLTMHHALYDGWSLPLILNMVDNAYRGGRLQKETAFSSFIHYIRKQIDDIKTTEYWQTTLQGHESAPFPALPTSIDRPVSDTVVHHRVTRLKDSRFDVTPSILARAAWGIVLARTVNTEETVFGVTVSGRNAPVAGIDKMAAPAFATVPLRVHTEPGQKVSDYLETMQQQATDMIPYEQTGMQHIAKVSPGARQACEFQTLLVVQQGDTSLEETELGCWINRNQTEFFNPYALMVEVGLLESGDMALKASFDSRVISHWMVERLLNQFSFVVKQLQRARPRQTLGEIDTMTELDIQEIWAGKHVVPESVANVCIHELVRRRAEMHPHKQAICAWDGDFSYMELDQLSSVLSRRLIYAGVYQGQLIPLCFQKSKWTPVAILAVLKAGGAFVLLDPSLPEERLKAIAGQLDSDLILSSVSEEQLSSRLVHCVIRVGPELLNDTPPDLHSIPRQSATTTMFVIFTSGSTGVPKGVMMTHVNFASGLYHQLQPLGFNETSRVFDFASYAFDIAVHNVFAALVSGGCLCIPSEESRRGNIGKAMVDMRVTIADITPSVGRLLDPESLPQLETIIFAGEDLTAADSIRWSGYARVINAYGPAETGIATVNPDASNGRTHIGPGYGVNSWVVDPNNHNRLVTPGSTGELLLEGPIVSSGYLNDPKKTASSFIQDPPWLLQGSAGRSGRLYKTGDLVQCGQHGDLVFLGRKDDQVKIRGQRVELGEVEHWVRHSFSHAEQVAAEVITPRGENVKSTLVAFVQSITDRGVLAVSPGVREELAQNLPSYMLPSAFLALEELPMTATGKINRKELRKIGATFSTDQLIEKDDTTATVKEQPATETERRMQSIWCSIFDLEPSQIGLDDSFFRLGGDSIIAMKLVGEAYKVGVDMSVADVFKYRTLRNICRHSKMSGEKTSQRIEPFSLMASDIDIGEIAAEIKTDPSNIRDIYPCTPLQEGLVSLGLKRAGDCVAQATLEISPEVDMAAFCHAWEEVVCVIDILRTRIVQHERLGLVQVVLGPETPFTWKKASDLEDYQGTDRAEHMAIPGPLTRYALVKSPDSEKRWFVWTIHHALYDGWSVPLLLRAVEKAYLGERVPPGTQFQAFIQHLQQTDETVSKGYWQDTLEGCDNILFPSLPPRYDQPMADSFITYRMPCPSSPDITTSTMIRAAWALVLADTTASSDVVFGTTVSGRNAPVHGINDMVAPTISTVPVRTRIPRDRCINVTKYLRDVQQQTVDMIPFEQTGLHHIAKMSSSAKQACSFQNLIVLQPKADDADKTFNLGEWHNAEQAKWFGMYPLTLNMQLGDDTVAISAVSDSRTVKPWLVRKLLERLEFVTQELSNAGPETMLYEIASITPEDLDDVWSWNDSFTRRWVVDEASHCLVPPGCVGELLLETSNDANLDKLKISETEIVRNPAWLAKGSARYPGRRGTLYKTGDLVHHNERGELIYIARRGDALVKLQGQRINLNMVESRVTQLVPDAKKAVVVHVPVDHQSLVAFVQIEGTQSITSLGVPAAAEEDLAARFPSSSMPRTFLAISHIPLTSTGHPNREQLRQVAISFFSHQAAQQDVSESLPKSHVELQLQKIWARVLSIEPITISLHHDFFHMGGDSVAAIKVASESKKVGITLTVADMFRYPTLAEAARAVLNQNGASSIKNISPFALLGGGKMDVQQTVSDIASKIGTGVDAVQDAYPCTPLQAGLMSLSSKRAGGFVLQATLELDANCNMNVFKEAWEAAYNALPILRTRIIHSDLGHLLQVVTNEPLRWIESSVPLKEYLHLDQNMTMDLGQPLSRYTLIREGGKPKYFVWTIHHALYDGWSMGLLLNMVNDAFHGQIASQDRPQFQHFIKYLDKKDEQAEDSYWREYLGGYDSAPYPELPRSIMEQPTADSTIERSVKHLSESRAGVLASTVIHASWALVAGGMAGSDDVVFGVTLSGRNAPISNIHNMHAPTMATVPVRIAIDKCQKVSAFLASVQNQATEMIPFEQTGLHRIAQVSEQCQRACGFQTLLIVHPKGTTDIQPAFGSWVDSTRTENFNAYAIMFEIFLGQNDATVKVSFDSRVVAAWIVENLVERFESIVGQLVNAGADATINDMTIMTQRDLDLIWQRNGNLPRKVECYVHDIVTETAKFCPSAQAIHAWDGDLTYAELDALSDSLAAHFHKRAVQPGQTVPVCFEKSMWTPVVMLSLLKAQAAFVLLDTSLPEERLKAITSQVGSDYIVSSIHNRALSSRLARRVIDIGPGTIDRSLVLDLPEPTQDYDATMFVIFTSGSTGTPKGVMLSHANFASQIEHQAGILGYNSTSRVFDFAAYSFDAAVHNVFTTFAVGGCLCIPSGEDRKGDITRVMADMAVTLADLTPTVARLLNPAALPALENLTLSGEAVTVDDVERWWGHSQVINAYGPAEAGISTINHTAKSPEEVTSIGFGAGLITWIVHPDDSNVLLPPGVVGELLLEGPLVGKGYLNDSAKTAASFIDSPVWMSKTRSSRLYKTGDLVQYAEDGSMVYLGRKDTQVKIRGQRIELGEIEHCLGLCLPKVQQVVVEAVKLEGSYKETVLAAFTTEDSQHSVSSITPKSLEADVMDQLASQLPAAMIPSVFFLLPELPRTATGKTDRKKLRELGSTFSIEQLAMAKSSGLPKVQPTTPMQIKMQTIWATVLALDASLIGLDDSFIQLGGDSIAAMKVVGETRQLGLCLSVADIFRTPKLRDLSDGVSATSEEKVDTINIVAHSDPVELSFAQGRLWFVEQLYPGLTWFLMPFAMRFRGPLQIDALEQTLHAIENRHDALRSTFLTKNGVHFQQVHPFIARKMPVIDVSAGGEEALTKALRTEQATTFDLSREAGWRVMLFRLGPNHHVLSIVLHHINADGWSINVIRKELTQFYSAAIKGQDPTSKLDPLPIQYRDYSAWQKQKFDKGDFEHQLAYWTSKLEASRPAEFLCDKPRPKAISGKANAHEWRIEGHVYDQVREFCKNNDVTPFVVMLAAFRTMHYCMTGTDDATIGTANANRDHWQLKDMIGFFVNMQCLRIKVQDDTFRSIVSQVQQTLAESFNNQDVPFEQIVSALKRERDLSRQPIVQVVFALHALGTSGTIGLEGIESEMLDLEPTSRFDLELHLFEEKAAFNGVLVFSTDLYAPETIASMVGVFNTILEGAMHNPDEKIADLPLLNCEGHDLLKSMGLIEMERTDYPQNSNVVSVFQQQAAINGNKVAVKGSCHQITYAELDSMSDSVACWLMAQEFGAQAVIPVMAKRSPETIVAFIGILKANMAYLPLDAKTPSGRLHSILSSIKNPTVILLGADVDLPTEIDTPSSSIQTVLKTNTQPSTHQRPVVVKRPSSSSLAYILFTSGSTGQPKGVMIEHRGILRLVLQNNYTRSLSGAGAVAHMSSIAFDASVLEIYTALLNGLTLTCVDQEVLLDPVALQKTFLEGKVSAALFTPAHLKQVLAEKPDTISQLDTLLVGGDRFDPDDCILAAKRVKGHVINAYGPTENTVISTLYHFSEADTWANGVPIGRSISNSGAYIMDSQMRLLPLGAIGELVVTGDGLARGYSESERDIGRFVVIEIDGVKMRGYRTGDLARFRPVDGQIEFFGRKDVQVKIRGHRVELGEIEHVLLGHSLVTDAAALIHQEDGRQAQLHVFVVAQHQERKVKDGTEDPDAEAGHIQTWKRLFDNDHYVGIEDMKDIGRDFKAWTSMYDGALIDKGEMNEWLDDTIATINQNIGAGHILEIGTGTGMILFNLIDVLETYIGLDPAERAVDYVNKTINSNSSLADRIRVYRGTADRLDYIPGPITPNLIICNSVAQYFPSQEYLFNIIKDIARRPGVETLFFGDMRSQALYTEFCVTKGLSVSGDAITKQNLRRRIAEIEADEMELLIDPGFFTGLKSRLADYVEHVEILAKNMVATNELSCYRYAAVVHIKQRSRCRQIHDIDQHDRVDFAGEGLDHAALVYHLQRSSSRMISVENIPHRKTIYERFVVNELANTDDEEHKDWLSSLRLAAQQAPALSVCELNEIAQQAGYRVQVSWARQHVLQGGFDAVFHRVDPEREGTRVLFTFPSDEQGRPLQTLSSKPLSHRAHRKVQDELQTRLHHHLPSYMCPQTITILDEMPINTSGKVDRKALAEMLHARTAPTLADIRKPNTMAEEQLQHIWAGVLNLDPSSIGLEDNFFQLGGNSITAMRVITETRKQGMDLEISDIFRSKNLEDLAGLSLKHVDKVEMDQEQGPLVSEDTMSSLLAELGGDNQFQAILPLTSMQELYIAEGKSAGGQFANYFFLDLPTGTNPEKLRASCQQLLCNVPILRASFLSIAGRYWQVVPHTLDVPWLELNTEDSLQQFSLDFCHEDMKKISYVGPPVLFTLVKHKIEGVRLIFRLSHAQYDGVSFPSIVQALFSAYFGASHSFGPDYSTFLLHAMRQRPASIAYWKNLLQGSSLESIRSYLPLCDRGVEPRPVAVQAEVALPSVIGNMTTATIASAAWALLMARITGSQDVVYGHAVAGRNSHIPRIDELVGPCLTIVPVRATLSSSQTCQDFLRRLQIQFSSMGDADSLSYRDIINDCTEWPADAQFDTIIHHANLDEHPQFDFGGEKTKLQFFRNKQLVPNHTTLMSYPLGDRLQFNVISSTHIMSEETASTLASCLCEIVTRMDARPKEAISTWLSEVYREI